MTQFAPVSGGSGFSHDFFRPANEASGIVYALEVEGYEMDRPTPYGPKNTATAKAYRFTDGKGQPQIGGISCDQAALSRALRDKVGQTVLVTLGKGEAKAGQSAPWIWENVNPADYPEIVAFFEAREAEKDDAPSFA